jgi:hypothetical protein
VKGRGRGRNRVVRIANPVSGGKKYTSLKRVLGFLRSGRGKMTLEGEFMFYDSPSLVARREAEEVDASIRRHRGGVVYWNGDDKNPMAQHRPGEARS